MNCIVTAGPTYEPLDEVRRLTNFSTGRLGTELAAFFADRGNQVRLLIGEQATWCGPRQAAFIETFSTTTDLLDRLRVRAGSAVQAVFHTAAVSDFQFGRVWRQNPDGSREAVAAGKIPSRGEDLLVELKPTPKIIHQLRDWFPQAFLVGWKYEVDGGRDTALRRAMNQIQESRTNACVVNGPAYGAGFGIIEGPHQCIHCDSRATLYEQLLARLAKS